jgi:type VI secretion system secreted protein Hcp
MVELALEADSGACRGPRGERQQICYRQAFPKGPSFFGHHPLGHFHLFGTRRVLNGAREGARQMKNAFAVIATVGVASVLPMQAQAATDLFLTWPGIIGPSTIQGHAGDIELTSYTQTASNTASQSSGGGGSGKAVCGAITITKGIDSTSPVFLGMVLSGRHTAGPVTVTFAKSKQDTTFYTVSLRDVIPTSITQSDDPGPGRITETIVLSASQFEFTFTPQLPNGGFGTPVKFGFDCVANKQL